MSSQNQIRLSIIILFAALASTVFIGLESVAAQDKPTAVQGILPVDSAVAATPVPKPVRLEKIDPETHLGTAPQINQHVKTDNNLLKAVVPVSKITGCEIKSQVGNEMVLRISYEISPEIDGPFYCGAFLYQSRQEAVNAGYKPLQLVKLPNGTADLVMVFPDTAFTAAYVETFLIHSGKIITKARFKLPFSWTGNTGRFNTLGPGYHHEKANTPENPLSYCEAYAKAAVEQYRMARKYDLPDIAVTGWSDDFKGHLNWCSNVPKSFARSEDTKRQSHLKKYLHNDSNTQYLLIPGLDPGLGP